MEEMLLFGWMSRFAEAECIDSTTPGVTTKIFFARHGKKILLQELQTRGDECWISL